MRILLLSLILTSASAANASGFLFDGFTPTKLKPVPPVTKYHAPKPKKDVVLDEDKITDAQHCPTCESAKPSQRAPQRLPIPRVAGRSESVPVAQESSSLTQCLSRSIVSHARSWVQRRYHNQPRSGGACGRGVGESLFRSGMSPGSGIADAIDFHLAGALKARGFKNIMSPGMTSATAPPGAVLVFKGQKTNMSRIGGGLPPMRLRRGAGAGTWVGHVTIKSDKADEYFTDGKTVRPAIPGRTLVAVYVPVKCDKRCQNANPQCAAFF